MADILADGSEIFHYDIPDFPVSIKKNQIPANACINDLSIHWHEEIEITYVVSGSVKHILNGKRLKIEAGEAIYINSKQLHLIEADNVDCVLYCLIFHPMLLGASNFIAKKYVMPIIENEQLDYFMLRASEEKQKRVLDAIVRIASLQEEADYEMKTMQILYQLWLDLYAVLPKAEGDKAIINEDLHCVHKMLAFIHQNYAEDIGLGEICASGQVGKTKGTSVFREYLNMPPVEYLINYRLEIAARLLTKTKDSVLEIAVATGFSDSSYFARIFRKRVGISPLEYREQHRS